MFRRMTTPPEASGPPPADGCAELRAAVGMVCADAHAAQTAALAAGERLRDLRRDLVAAQHRQEEAEGAAAPALRSAEKARARQVYEEARRNATTDAERTEATATWARTVDTINRAGRTARRAVDSTRSTVQGLEEAVREAVRTEQTERIRAESAEAACLDARVSLAACEEGTAAGDVGDSSDVPAASAANHAASISEADGPRPLVIVAMVSGDRQAVELAASEVSEHAGLTRAEATLQLQELVDAIVSAAAAEGFLVFDGSHHFWAHLSFEESRDVVSALARLGFTVEPSEGWHANRSPGAADLSMALAYAGLDPRNMRDLPTVDELRALPDSIGVDARAFLARQAPDLAVDQVVRILGRRADPLEPLWDAWGQVRPILLGYWAGPDGPPG